MKWWIGEDTGFFDEEDIRNSEYNIKRNWYYNNENMPDLYGKKPRLQTKHGLPPSVFIRL